MPSITNLQPVKQARGETFLHALRPGGPGEAQAGLLPLDTAGSDQSRALIFFGFSLHSKFIFLLSRKRESLAVTQVAKLSSVSPLKSCALFSQVRFLVCSFSCFFSAAQQPESSELSFSSAILHHFFCFKFQSCPHPLQSWPRY